MNATASIQVFQCDALHVKLSRASCVTRYRFANQKRKPGQDALKAAQYEQCMGCDLGAAHRRGDPTPRELLVTITPKPSKPAELHKDMTVARNYQPRTCQKCGDMFSPRGPRTQRCDECRAAHGTPSRPKSNGNVRRKASASSPPPPPPPPIDPDPEPEPAPPPKTPAAAYAHRAAAVAAARMHLEAAGHRVSVLGDDTVDILVVH